MLESLEGTVYGVVRVATNSYFILNGNGEVLLLNTASTPWTTTVLCSVSSDYSFNGVPCLGRDGRVYATIEAGSGLGIEVPNVSKLVSVSTAGDLTEVYSHTGSDVLTEVVQGAGSTMVAASLTKLYSITDGTATELYTHSSIDSWHFSLALFGNGNVFHVGEDNASFVCVSQAGQVQWTVPLDDASAITDSWVRNAIYDPVTDAIYVLARGSGTLYKVLAGGAYSTLGELELGADVQSDLALTSAGELFFLSSQNTWATVNLTTGSATYHDGYFYLGNVALIAESGAWVLGCYNSLMQYWQ